MGLPAGLGPAPKLGAATRRPTLRSQVVGQYEILSFTELPGTKVPGTFPTTPATTGTWPALLPPGVFEFTLRIQLAPDRERSGASNRV